MNKTPLNFIKEKGLLKKYYKWKGYVVEDRGEYFRERYHRKNREAIQNAIEAKRNPL